MIYAYSRANRITGLLVLGAVVMLSGCASITPSQSTILLTGAKEVPVVSTPATGSAQITVLPDRSIRGDVTTSGVTGIAAHIHDGRPDTNGPVIVPLTKGTADTWVVPPGATLTAAQYQDYLAGNLYVNVHSAAHPDGEIRAQLPPPQPEVRPTMHYGY